MPISRGAHANIRRQVDPLRVALLRRGLRLMANLFGATELYLHQLYKCGLCVLHDQLRVETCLRVALACVLDRLAHLLALEYLAT